MPGPNFITVLRVFLFLASAHSIVKFVALLFFQEKEQWSRGRSSIITARDQASVTLNSLLAYEPSIPHFSSVSSIKRRPEPFCDNWYNLLKFVPNEHLVLADYANAPRNPLQMTTYAHMRARPHKKLMLLFYQWVAFIYLYVPRFCSINHRCTYLCLFCVRLSAVLQMCIEKWGLSIWLRRSSDAVAVLNCCSRYVSGRARQ